MPAAEQSESTEIRQQLVELQLKVSGNQYEVDKQQVLPPVKISTVRCIYTSGFARFARFTHLARFARFARSLTWV